MSQRSPDNTSIKLSDALNLFEADALAPGVTVQKADYSLFASDLGFKKDGWFLQGEGYFRWLDHFEADGPLPLDSIYDSGLMVQLAKMAVPRKLELYAATSYIYGQFNDSWEVLGGSNLYLANTRNVRLNLQVIHVDKSAVSSSFGYYVGGQTGTTVSAAASILF